MQKNRFKNIKLTLIAMVVAAPASVSATTLDFDCDAFPDRTSSIAQIVRGPEVTIRGAIAIVQKRSGRFLPLAGVLLSPVQSKSNEDFVGFQIAATRDGKETSNISLRDNRDKTVIRDVAKIEDIGLKRFTLGLTSSGILKVSINNNAYTMEIPRAASWSNIRVQALCSTGQFKFLDYQISNEVLELDKSIDP